MCPYFSFCKRGWQENGWFYKQRQSALRFHLEKLDSHINSMRRDSMRAGWYLLYLRVNVALTLSPLKQTSIFPPYCSFCFIFAPPRKKSKSNLVIIVYLFPTTLLKRMVLHAAVKSAIWQEVAIVFLPVCNFTGR